MKESKRLDKNGAVSHHFGEKRGDMFTARFGGEEELEKILPKYSQLLGLDELDYHDPEDDDEQEGVEYEDDTKDDTKDSKSDRYTLDEVDKSLLLIGCYAKDRLTEGYSQRAVRDTRIRNIVRLGDVRVPAKPQTSAFGTNNIAGGRRQYSDPSTLKHPLIYQALDTLHAYYTDSSTGLKPFFRADPIEQEDQSEQLANTIADSFDNILRERTGYKAKMDEAIYLSLKHGVSYLLPYWNKRFRTELAYKPLDSQNHFELGYTMTGDTSVYKNMDTGELKAAGSMVEAMVSTETGDFPDFEVIKVFSYIQYPMNAIRDEDLIIAGQVYTETVSSIRAKGVMGVYDEEKVKLIFGENSNLEPVGRGGVKTHLKGALTNDTETGVSDNLGETASTMSDRKQQDGKRIYNGDASCELVRFWTRVDTDNSKQESNWMFVMETSTGIILSAQPIICFGNSDSPFIPVCIYTDFSHPYGVPVGEVLASAQITQDELGNAMIDATKLGLVMIIEQTSGVKNGLGNIGFTPGINQRVTNEKDSIRFIIPPKIDQVGFDQFQRVKGTSEETLAISETIAGIPQNNKTATETNVAARNAERRLRLCLERLANITLRTLGRSLWELVKRYGATSPMGDSEDGGTQTFNMPYSFKRVDGKMVIGKLTRQELQTPVILTPNSSAESTDSELKKQMAEKVYMIARENPIIANDPVKMHHVLTLVLTAIGFPDVRSIIGTVEDVQQKLESSKGVIQNDVEASKEDNAFAVFLANMKLTDPDNVKTILDLLEQITVAKAAGDAALAQQGNVHTQDASQTMLEQGQASDVQNKAQDDKVAQQEQAMQEQSKAQEEQATAKQGELDSQEQQLEQKKALHEIQVATQKTQQKTTASKK
jgi:hypothetical protein